ncbi:WD domain protein [Scheffersomyces amazonensis]|uniref:WD domain protein n=1 Tax=Scheffersomyces amazonensis TaxID=1078765 RepID=UPI00315CDDB8
MVVPVSNNGISHSHNETKEVLSDLYTVKHKIRVDSTLTSIKISPNGKTFTCCSSDNIIRVYDLVSGQKIASLKGHTKGISDIVYSPINSDIIASCSDDLTIRLWSISKKTCIKILKKHTYHITTIKFTSKGNILISGSADETITIWDITSGKTLKTLAAHSDPVSSLSLTPDSSIIVSSSYDGLMRLFDLESGQCLKTLTYNSTSHGTATASTNDVLNFPISNVEMSPNGKYILSSSLDGLIRLWDYMDNKVLKTYRGIDNRPISEKFNCGTRFITRTSNPLIVSGSESLGLLIWDLQSKKVVYQLQDSQEPVFEVDIYEEGKILVSCSKDGIINVLELNPKFLGITHDVIYRDDTPFTPHDTI